MAPSEAPAGAGEIILVVHGRVIDSSSPHRPQSTEPEIVVEYVMIVDTEAGFAASNPRDEIVRVVPTMKDKWPPENGMHDFLVFARSTEEMETLIAGPKSDVVSGLKAMSKWELRQKLLKELADQKLRYDLRTLPEQATLERYEGLPVEEVGEALLRGMGWEKGQTVGRNATVVVAPVETVRRPRFLGLGAVPAQRRDLRASRAA